MRATLIFEHSSLVLLSLIAFLLDPVDDSTSLSTVTAFSLFLQIPCPHTHKKVVPGDDRRKIVALVGVQVDTVVSAVITPL